MNPQKAANLITAASPGAAIWLWLEWADLILRVSVGLGSLILICFALRVKFKAWRADK